MNINSTILIQSINFIITYKFLKNFLFKPIIESLNKKKEEQKKLNSEIEDIQGYVLHLEKEKSKNLDIFQYSAKKNYPFEPQKYKSKLLETPIPKISIIDVEKTKKDLKEFLLEKAVDV